MALRCLDSAGLDNDSDLVTCVDYARTNGLHIINTSLDSDTFSWNVPEHATENEQLSK